jgi:hypothetical protein
MKLSARLLLARRGFALLSPLRLNGHAALAVINPSGKTGCVLTNGQALQSGEPNPVNGLASRIATSGPRRPCLGWLDAATG